MLAHDLIVWTQALLLDGELAKAEPKRLRYQLLHIAARLAFSGQRAKLHLQETWPWATELVDAFAKLKSLPAPPADSAHRPTHTIEQPSGHGSRSRLPANRQQYRHDAQQPPKRRHRAPQHTSPAPNTERASRHGHIHTLTARFGLVGVAGWGS